MAFMIPWSIWHHNHKNVSPDHGWLHLFIAGYVN